MIKKVLLGMSGGIDSSAAAMILQEQGFDVTGITFLFAGTYNTNHHVSKNAKILSQKLGIEHYIIDLLEPVAKVARGQTAVLYDDECVIGGGFIDNSA